MTLVDNHGRVITQEELAASYVADMRDYAGLSPEEIDARLWKLYPGVMRRQAATQRSPAE
jgi:hypothetical protein